MSFVTRNMRVLPAILCLAATLTHTPSQAETLDLPTALALARDHDVTVPGLQADAHALSEQAVANRQLPDPKLKLGLMSLPTDTFSRSQEPMTQMQVGVVQAFPPGDTLALRGQRTEAMARAVTESASARALQVERDVRLAYLELYYQLEAGHIVRDTRHTFAELLDVTRSHYAAGRKNQQDVLGASVELALLDDRLARIETDTERARASLAELVGTEPARQPLARTFPTLPTPPPLAELDARLRVHPDMRARTEMVNASQLAVDEARQRYRPGWSLDITYGDRSGSNADGSDRADFLSAMVMVDLPLFRDKRQDRTLAARHQEVTATSLKREARYLQLKKELASQYAQWQHSRERLLRFRITVLPEAQQAAAASLSAYQSGVTDFSGLIRARLLELDSQLKTLRLRIDHARAQAQLLYLAGDPV